MIIKNNRSKTYQTCMVKRNKDHYRIRELIHQLDITIINIYVSNGWVPKYIRQKLTELKGEINSNTILNETSNISLSTTGRSSRQRINKEKADMNNAIDQMDLTDIYGTFYPTTEFTFSSAHFLRQSIC